MNIAKTLYGIANELYEILEVLYSGSQRKLHPGIALISLIMLVFSVLYGGISAKVAVVSISFTTILLSRKNFKDIIHVYLDLMTFILLTALPAAIVLYMCHGDASVLALSLSTTIFNAIAISTSTVAMTVAIGVKEIRDVVSRVSKIFGTLFIVTLLALPKTVLYTASLILARVARTIELRRLYIMRLLTASLGDAVLYSTAVSYQMMLVVESRTISDTSLRRYENKLKSLDCFLLLISISIAVAVYFKWM